MISSLASDQIIFATAGYDHTIRFWNPNSGQCYRVLQHAESVSIPKPLLTALTDC